MAQLTCTKHSSTIWPYKSKCLKWKYNKCTPLTRGTHRSTCDEVTTEKHMVHRNVLNISG